MAKAEQAVSLPLTSFPPVVAAVSRARHVLGDFVTGRVDAAAVEAALLLGSELATNAVLHAHTEFTLSAVLTPGMLRISVTDGDHRPPVLTHPAEGGVGGWGIHLVDVLASRWGVEQFGTGKRVWFELDVEPGRRPDAAGPFKAV